LIRKQTANIHQPTFAALNQKSDVMFFHYRPLQNVRGRRSRSGRNLFDFRGEE